MKDQGLPVSGKKNFEVCLHCSHVQNCDPQGHHMNKVGRGPQRDAKYHISKLYTF